MTCSFIGTADGKVSIKLGGHLLTYDQESEVGIPIRVSWKMGRL